MVSNWLTTNYEDCVLKVSMHKGEIRAQGYLLRLQLNRDFKKKMAGKWYTENNAVNTISLISE